MDLDHAFVFISSSGNLIFLVRLGNFKSTGRRDGDAFRS